MDAFDADVLIYAAVDGHPLGMRVRALFPPGPIGASDAPAGIGSVLLLPELLAKPTRAMAADELATLDALLGRLDLSPVDRATAELAAALGGLLSASCSRRRAPRDCRCRPSRSLPHRQPVRLAQDVYRVECRVPARAS